ncbi:hypothetical protein [Streptomyces sp. 8L]|uniref:hypothetical protein n=1 Tax=Streptomyces sp. 8L TaxID=2877242 RepID=UPI001CD80057|nr:hypothetical protein [Streptomyces sp. 8L]MCA1216988.1 hypothetical protein [Streptomyces sp. 8L]
MRVHVTPEVRALGLHHVRVWRLSSDRPLLADDGLSADRVRALYDDASPLPEGYRKLLAELGHPDSVPAGERLRELVRTRGFGSHGAVVDAVTAATLRYGAGIGLHRPGPAGPGPLVVARAAGGERIVPAFSTRSKPVPAGDLVYGLRAADGTFEPFAWLGRRDCDAADWQLRPDDTEALVVVLGCPGQGADHSDAIGQTLRDVLAEARPDVVFEEVTTEEATTEER